MTPVATLDRIIALKPDDMAAKWNKSVICLGLGRFQEGWPLYEHRWAGAKGPGAAWLRASRAGTVDALTARCMIWGEQGLGDEILHASMMPDVIARTPSVVFEVEPRLAPLFARSFPQCQGDRLPAGALCGQSSMRRSRWRASAAILRRSWEEFPRRGPRLSRCRRGSRAGRCVQRLASDGRKVIGLSWVSKAPVGGRIEKRAACGFRGVAAAASIAASSTCNMATPAKSVAALARDLGRRGRAPRRHRQHQ